MSKSELNSILKAARAYVNKEFRPGVVAQCAMFVRQVFEDAGCYVGIANHPSDEKLLPPGEPLGASYANSFSGDDVGRKITDIYSLMPGDIVMFKNTYGNYADGVITHVGIMSNSTCMIHRPTASKPVQKIDIINSAYWFNQFKEARRLDYLDAEMFDKIKIFLHNDKVSFFPSNVTGVRFKYHNHNGKSSCVANITIGTTSQTKSISTRKVKCANIKSITINDTEYDSEVYHILVNGDKAKLYDSSHLISDCYMYDCSVQNDDYRTRNLILKAKEIDGFYDLSSCEAVMQLE